MTRLRKTLLAGIAALGIGFAGAASAQTFNAMIVPVPGGGVAQVHYIGEVPPQIVFMPAPAAFPAALDPWMPVSSIFGHEAPFAMLDRVMVEMDRRAAAMFRYAEAIVDRAKAGGVIEAEFGALPPGGQSYSFVSTVSGNGVCMRSVRITSRGDGAPPLVERHSSGNCGMAAAPQGRSRVQPAAPVPTAPPRQPDLILTQNGGLSPYAGMVRQVASTR